MKPVVYIDGKDGTAGLQIYDRLSARSDIELLLIDEDKRKDKAERARLMNAADIVFLCLPDAAAIEAVELVTNPDPANDSYAIGVWGALEEYDWVDLVPAAVFGVVGLAGIEPATPTLKVSCSTN